MKRDALLHQAAWVLVSTGSVWLARKAARGMLVRGWQAAAGGKPPRRRSREHGLGTVVAWTAAAAALASVAELLAERGAEAGWRRATGKKPPRLFA
jgi:hypothetical protein